jgi:hypothetical protein
MNLYVYEINVPEAILANDIQKPMYSSMLNVNVATKDNEPYDYFLVPVMFLTEPLEKDQDYFCLNTYIDSLQYFKQFPEKHVFLLNSDFKMLSALDNYNIKVFCNSCYESDDNIYPLPFFIQEGFETLIKDKDISQADYDINFQGCNLTNSHVRNAMVCKMGQYKELYKIYLEVQNKYFYCIDMKHDDRQLEKTRYYNNIIDSKFVLCPRGTGSTSARFFETIWFGRIPILIADDTKLPLEHIIPWNNLIIKVSEKDMDIHEKIQDFLNTKDIEQISLELKTLATRYFDIKKIPELIKLELKEKQI